MKKFVIPIMILAILVALYEQGQPKKNVYVLVCSIVVFMLGMMKLSANTPSRNQNKEDGNV